MRDGLNHHPCVRADKNTPTVTEDGHEWIPRAGYLWGNYKTVQSYIGFRSIQSVVAYAARHNLRRIKHGKQTLLRKDQVDLATGASMPLSKSA